MRDYVVTEDMPGIGLVRGQRLILVSTHKALGRKTLKDKDGKEYTVDGSRVKPILEDEK